MPEDEECALMYEAGMIWRKENEAHRKSVSVVNDGLHLAGEYYDFGYSKAVIIIPGRTETCYYSCYFAEVYKKSGYNVLTIDNRAHGESDGKIASLGFREYGDVLAWGKFLHEKYQIHEIVLHGICIGASTALFTMTDKTCPDYFKAMVAEGMYTTFYHSFLNHMRVDRHPIFPFTWETMLYMRLISGANAVTDGPAKRMPLMQKPILFLHSRMDQFSSPEASEKMYQTCTAPHRVIWFDQGGHSRIRIHNTEKYDSEIHDFLV